MSSNLAVAEKGLKFVSAPNCNNNDKAAYEVICRLHLLNVKQRKKIKNILRKGMKKD